MSLFIFNDPDNFWMCPFDPNHKVLAKRFQYHLVRCAKANPTIRRVKCVFNASHLMRPDELIKHMSTCPDSAVLSGLAKLGMYTTF
ncbi:unnamed protein product [Didymodactylos carnosus]|uniref:CHHC U11-48K-type domain-containing protein n=1 Tax=Didymodactylos carnosus TaxID=1234261 RepID=A0A816G6V9_9BILA|nr:unnamed protein product [Didymodactylos carnosus]CAF4642513.1 unnamed protein product [Didymodactylos carnosus]